MLSQHASAARRGRRDVSARGRRRTRPTLNDREADGTMPAELDTDLARSSVQPDAEPAPPIEWPRCASPGSARCRRPVPASRRAARDLVAALARPARDRRVRRRPARRGRSDGHARHTTSSGAIASTRTTSRSTRSATPRITTISGPISSGIPGLTVLHDVQLHHARAAALLRRGRAADYRARVRRQSSRAQTRISPNWRSPASTRRSTTHWPMTRLRRRRPRGWPPSTRHALAASLQPRAAGGARSRRSASAMAPALDDETRRAARAGARAQLVDPGDDARVRRASAA